MTSSWRRLALHSAARGRRYEWDMLGGQSREALVRRLSSCCSRWLTMSPYWKSLV